MCYSRLRSVRRRLACRGFSEEKVSMQEVVFILPSLNRWCLVILVQDIASPPLWVSVEKKVGMQEVLSSLLRTKENKVLVVDGQQNPLRTKALPHLLSTRDVSCAGVIRSGGALMPTS